MMRDNSYLIENKHAKGNKPNKTSFKKGGIPWNKGKKGIHLSPKSEFKKGHSQTPKMLIGTITKRRCKNGRYRKFIKIGDPNIWIENAKQVWIESFGKILTGDIIHHINGDSLDDRVDNLVSMPRKDHPYWHGRWGLKLIPKIEYERYKSRYYSLHADSFK